MNQETKHPTGHPDSGYEKRDVNVLKIGLFGLAGMIVLAALMVPFIIMAVYFALKGNFTAHTRITKRLWPVWMFVSLSGVVVYLMLYVL